MSLSEAQKKYLRGLGHELKPVVMIGHAGLSSEVYDEFESALEHHELIKLSVRVGNRKLRDQLIAQLCVRSNAELVQRIGNMALFYRPNPEKNGVCLPAA